MHEIEAQWHGLTSYNKALNEQLLQRQKAKVSGGGAVLGYEHPTVITLGVRGRPEDVHSPLAGVEVIETDRGGQATLHSPGQLVIYPVLAYRSMGFRPIEFMDLLFDVTQATFKKCNIIVIRKNNGLHTKYGKIAAVGLNIKRGISSHGISINIENETQLFNAISACGVAGAQIDRLRDHCDITTQKFYELWVVELQHRLTHRNKTGE